MPIIVNTSLLPALSTLRELLNIISTLRGISDPFGSLDGLRGAIALLLRLGTTLQINPKWLAWLQSVSDDDSLLNLLLAVGEYLESLVNQPAADQHAQSDAAAASDIANQAIDFASWLAIIRELVQLLGQIRSQTVSQRSASRRG
jgi:hypothetical protein